MVKTSAPGKVHLIGEHSVVYGEPAIIAAIGKRTTIEAEKSNNIELDIHDGKYTFSFSPNEVKQFYEKLKNLWGMGKEKDNFSEVFSVLKEEWINNYKVIVAVAFKMFGIEGGIKLKVRTDIPLGAGLGSSASISVAITKAINEAYGVDASLEKINDVAYRMEQFAHGMPSGGDNAAICYGGLVWFEKAKNHGENNVIKSLKEEIPYKLENFVIVYTKQPEKTTGELVQHVKNLDSSFRDPKIRELGEATYSMKDALKIKDFGKVKKMMNLAQRNLKSLGVSVEEIDRIHERVASIGGAAKLCGAGGGGIVLCYHEDKEKLINAIKELGFEPWETELAVEGVRTETKT